MRVCRPRPQSAERTHIDDAPSALSQIRQRLARHQKRSARVRSKNRIPLRHRDLLKLDGLVIGGIIHQHVDPAHFRRHFFHHLLDVLLIGHIAAHGQRLDAMPRQFSYHRPRLARRLAIRNRDVGAVFGGCQSNRVPQSLRRSRHQQRSSRKRLAMRRHHPEILRPSASWRPAPKLLHSLEWRSPARSSKRAWSSCTNAAASPGVKSTLTPTPKSGACTTTKSPWSSSKAAKLLSIEWTNRNFCANFALDFRPAAPCVPQHPL